MFLAESSAVQTCADSLIERQKNCLWPDSALPFFSVSAIYSEHALSWNRGSTEERKHGMELIEAELSDRIIGCAIRVHKALGPGFLEKVYEQALAIELRNSGLFFEQQKLVVIYHENHPVGDHRLDLLVAGKVVLELKACKAFEDVHLATLRSYLKATGCPVGILMNFARPTLEVKRVVLTV